jgi:hypothetical protein
MVDKNITSVFTCNEAKAFAFVKPFDGSLCHFFYLLFYELESQKASRKKPQSQKSLWPYERKNFQNSYLE